MSNVFRLLSARFAFRVSRPLVAAIAALGLLSASARYVPADFESLPTLAGGAGTSLTGGAYKVTANAVYAGQLAVADNATVTLWFTNAATLTVDLSAQMTSKAGVKVPSSSTLILRSADGTGSLVAKGAKGEDAEKGGAGENATNSSFGKGGNGGAGGAGGGAGIGGDGAGCVVGGSGGGGHADGSTGNKGETGGACGAIYVFDGVTVTAAGGAGGAAGGAGSAGSNASFGYRGGAGGGGGGAGGAAAALGGGGGSGGSGGGGGGGGSYGDGGGGGGGAPSGAGGAPTGTDAAAGSTAGSGSTGGAGGQGEDGSGSWNGGTGGSGGDAGTGGSAGTLACYQSTQINGGSTPTPSGVNAGSVAASGRVVTFDLCGESVPAGYDTYTLAAGSAVAQTPIVPPASAKFAGYYTAATGGACIIDQNGLPTGAEITSETTKLYAHWAAMYVNGVPMTTLAGEGWYVDTAQGKLFLTNAMTYTVNGRNILGNCCIRVTVPGTTLILDNVTITNTAVSPVDVSAAGTVMLRLKGTSTLSSTKDNCAGIHVAAESTLVIDRVDGEAPGSAKLTVSGGNYAAGIGANVRSASGSVILRGGVVTATGGAHSAGIGGADYGTGYRVTVEGGTLTATGKNDADDIGIGYYDKVGGSVVFKGGSIVATRNRVTSPTNALGAALYEVKVPADASPVLLEPQDFTYGTNDLVAVDGSLHLWLPAGDYALFVNGHPYQASVTSSGTTVSRPASVTASTWLQVRKSLTDGVSVTMACDIATDIEWCDFKDAAAGKSPTLDLNGHVLTHTHAGQLFYVRSKAKGVTFTIRDSSVAGTGEIRHTGGKGSSSVYGQFLYMDGAVMTVLESGVVSGFTVSKYGAAVYARGAAIFEMTGGVIRDCTSDSSGGAMEIYSTATFHMAGDALIVGCRASECGGGVYMHGGTAIIDGGVISNCVARLGAGLCVSGSDVMMNGGAIVNNRAEKQGSTYWPMGGGVYVNADTGHASFTLNDGRIAGNSVENISYADGSGLAARENASIVINGGCVEENYHVEDGINTFYIWDESSTIAMNNGIIDDDSRAHGTTRCVTLPEGYSLARFSGTRGDRFIVAQGASMDGSGRLTGGTFRFDPLSADYAAAGLRVADGYTVVAGESTWSIFHADFTVNGTSVSVGSGDGWSFDTDGLHLTAANKAYEITGISQSACFFAEADGQVVTLAGITNTCQNASAYRVMAGVVTNTLLLKGFNLLGSVCAGQPGIAVASGATLVIDAASADEPGFLLAQGAEGGAGIGGAANASAGTVRIAGGVVRAVGGVAAPALGAGLGGTAAAVFVTGGSVAAVGGTSPVASNDLVEVWSVTVPVRATGACIAFDKRCCDYSLRGVVPYEDKVCLWLPRGHHAFTLGGADYEAAVADADLNARLVSAGAVLNGSFEYGANLPGVGGSAPASTVGLDDGSATEGATLFGRNSAFAAEYGFTVGEGSYAVALTNGASVSLDLDSEAFGSRIFSAEVQGPVGATVRVLRNGNEVGSVTVGADGTAKARFLVSFGQGAKFLTLVNDTAGAGAVVALDHVRVFATTEVLDVSTVVSCRNGGFETGTGLPNATGAAVLGAGGATLEDWRAHDAREAGVFALATPGYPGVTEGDYALYLDPIASVEQTISVRTDQYYRVSFDCAAQTVGSVQGVKVYVRPLADDTESEIVVAETTDDGAWSSVSALVFMPQGSNVVRVANATASGRLLVDNFVCTPAVRVRGELLLNGGFEYGQGLPAKDGYGYAPLRGTARTSVWNVQGAAGVFGKNATAMTRAGTRAGNYGLFLQDGARVEQSFMVDEAGEYRIAFSFAARYAAEEGCRPVVKAFVDGVERAELRALSATSYEAGLLFADLAVGSHTLAFEVSAPIEQALLLDGVSVRARDPEASLPDVTGVAPVVRIVPQPAAVKLLTYGVEAVSSEGEDDGFAEEDFATDGTNNYFRLEPFAGAYPHPTYKTEQSVVCADGFAFSVGGVPGGTNDGPIVSFVAHGAAVYDERRLFAIAIARGGTAFAFQRYALGDGGRVSSVTNLFEVPMANVAQPGEVVAFALNASRESGTMKVGFHVNGRPCGSCDVVGLSAGIFDGLRLGALPAEVEDADDLTSQTCAKFDLTDLRVYATPLNGEQLVDLASSVQGTVVNITLRDAAQDLAYATHQRHVGGVYGPMAAIVPVRPGYAFLGWTVGMPGAGVYVTPTTVVTTQIDHDLCANWSNIIYRVTYDFDGYPFAQNTVQEIRAGETYALPAGFEVAGATFRGWTNALGTVIKPGMTFPSGASYADETLYADYDAGFGTLTFEPHNGGAATAVPNVEIGSPVLASAPADPVRTGYAFTGWFDAEVGGAKATDETAFANYRGETWHAQWLGHEQTNAWVAVGCAAALQTTVSRTGEAYIFPAEIPVPTNSVPDLKFYGWGVVTNAEPILTREVARYDYETETWIVAEGEVTAAEGQTLVALWWQACAFDANGGNVEEKKTYLYAGRPYGDWMSLPTPAQNGYDFDGWRIGSAAGETVSNATVVAEVVPGTLVAAWKPCTVAVSLDPNGGANDGTDVIGVTYQQPYGELPTPTRAGFALEAWHYLVESGKKVTSETIVSNYEDHTLVASWTNAWFAMSYMIGDKVVYGKDFVQRYENPWPALYVPTEAEIAAVAGAGRVFRGWALEETGEPVKEGETALMTRAGRLYALIEGATCTLSLDAAGGFLDPSLCTVAVEYGAVVPKLSTPVRPNCDFRGWFTAGGTEVKAGDTWTHPGETVLTAKWRGTVKLAFRFEANRSESSGDVQTVDGYYLDSMPAPTVPLRTDGATFLGWWCDGVQYYGADNRPLAGYEACPWEEGRTLVARWSMDRDFFAGAYDLVDGVTNTVVGVEATDEIGEPFHDGSGDLTATHWYRFEATNGVPVKVWFNDLTDVDWPCVALAVYRGDTLEDLEEVASCVEYESAEAVLEFTPDETGAYYLALAQGTVDNDGSSLAAYAVAVSGAGTAPFTSAWTDPATMPGETAQERNEAALLNDGFSAAVASRVAPTATYAAFTKWASVGNAASEIPPECLNDKTNVVLAAAYDLAVKPEGTVAVTACESTTNEAGVASLRLTVQVSGDFTAGGAKDLNLLVAAIGVTGSTAIEGPYSADSLECRIEAADASANTVRLLVTPKPVAGEAPTRFFFMGVTY